MKRSVVCHNWNQSHPLIQDIANGIKAWQMAGNGPLVVTVQPQTRSLEENRLLHSLVSQIAQQKEWAGQKRSAEIWKRLLTAAWCRATGVGIEVLPALDGHGVDLVPARTSKLTRGECAELIEFIQAWAAENDVVFSALEEER